jgi:hypothetical protein
MYVGPWVNSVDYPRPGDKYPTKLIQYKNPPTITGGAPALNKWLLELAKYINAQNLPYDAKGALNPANQSGPAEKGCTCNSVVSWVVELLTNRVPPIPGIFQAKLGALPDWGGFRTRLPVGLNPKGRVYSFADGLQYYDK